MTYTVGFIGLGHMGYPMANNLLQSDLVDKLYVFDLFQEPVSKLVSLGAHAVSDIKELAKKCDVIFTMLQTGDQVSKVCLEDNGIFKNCKKNLLYIDCSSIDVNVSKNLHQQAKEHGILKLDAPVSGGVKGAEAGSLTIMVGGDEKVLENKARPILDVIGANIIYAGDCGAGQVSKICNNMILGISMIAVSEAFNLGEKLGVKPQNLFNIISKGSGECWSLTKYCPYPNILENVPSSNDFKAGFTAEMMLKDLRLSQKAANSVNQATPLGANATALYSLFVNADHKDIDFSGIINFLN